MHKVYYIQQGLGMFKQQQNKRLKIMHIKTKEDNVKATGTVGESILDLTVKNDATLSVSPISPVINRLVRILLTPPFTIMILKVRSNNQKLCYSSKVATVTEIRLRSKAAFSVVIQDTIQDTTTVFHINLTSLLRKSFLKQRIFIFL